MKGTVLCVGPYNKPSNAYLRTLSFDSLGYTVFRVNVNDNLIGSNIIFRALRRIVWRPIFRLYLISKIRKKITRVAPNIIFVEKGVDFDSRDLLKFRGSLKSGTKLVHLNPDDPFGTFSAGWRRFISAIPHYDEHFVPKESNVSEYLGAGAKSVHVFDRAFDPAYHRPITLSPSDLEIYHCEVGFIGSYAEQRESVIHEMISRGISVTIWGDGWHRGRHWGVLKHRWRGRNQTGDNYIKAICGMDIALHFVRHENRDLHDSRTFEIPACGSFMLAERTTDHEKFFIEDQEAVFFDSATDCIEKCIYYSNNPNSRVLIASAGRQRVLKSGDDYTSRLREMLRLI